MPEDVNHTYKLEEPTGKVRLLISDIGGGDQESWIFTDKEIETFLGLFEGNVMQGAAIALRTMAGNEVMVAKKIKFLELETDGPATAKGMRDLAKELDKMSDEQVDFELIEMGVDLFSRRELRVEQFGEYW